MRVRACERFLLPFLLTRPFHHEKKKLWIGSIVGLSYILLMKAFNCCGRRAMAAEVERERERAAAAAAAASSESPSYDVIPITSPRPGARAHTPTLWNVVMPPV